MTTWTIVSKIGITTATITLGRNNGFGITLTCIRSGKLPHVIIFIAKGNKLTTVDTTWILVKDDVFMKIPPKSF